MYTLKEYAYVVCGERVRDLLLIFSTLFATYSYNIRFNLICFLKYIVYFTILTIVKGLNFSSLPPLIMKSPTFGINNMVVTSEADERSL